MTRKRWSTEDDSELLALRSQRVSTEHIARLLGRTQDAVLMRLFRLGAMKKRVPWTTEEVAAIGDAVGAIICHGVMIVEALRAMETRR